MIVSRLTNAILHPSCIVKSLIFVETRNPGLIKDQELYQLWETAKFKADFIERQSNYHAWDTNIHITNELVLRKLLEIRIDNSIKNRGITGC